MPDVLQSDCLLYLLALDHLTQRQAIATLHSQRERSVWRPSMHDFQKGTHCFQEQCTAPACMTALLEPGQQNHPMLVVSEGRDMQSCTAQAQLMQRMLALKWLKYL